VYIGVLNHSCTTGKKRHTPSAREPSAYPLKIVGLGAATYVDMRVGLNTIGIANTVGIGYAYGLEMLASTRMTIHACKYILSLTYMHHACCIYVHKIIIEHAATGINSRIFKNTWPSPFRHAR
jgi:hypothetical protein